MADQENEVGLVGEVPIVKVHKPEPEQPSEKPHQSEDDAEKNKQ